MLLSLKRSNSCHLAKGMIALSKWNHSVRDDASLDQVVECVDFLRSVGAKVQSPTFLRRLLGRVRYRVVSLLVYNYCLLLSLKPIRQRRYTWIKLWNMLAFFEALA